MNSQGIERGLADIALALSGAKYNLTIPDGGWIAPTLLNSWANYGEGYNVAGYFKDAAGFVHLKGLIKSGTTTARTNVFLLPSGYRPLENCIIATCKPTGAHCEMRVMSTGYVAAGDGGMSAIFTSLDGIVFKAEQ
jgi:hypothetical protein